LPPRSVNIITKHIILTLELLSFARVQFKLTFTASYIFLGFTGGSQSNYKYNGGANYQCLSLSPQYNQYYNESSAGLTMTSVEYASFSYGIFPNSTHGKQVPCAKCYTENRPAVMMIPAKRNCPAGWIREYEGTVLNILCQNIAYLLCRILNFAALCLVIF